MNKRCLLVTSVLLLTLLRCCLLGICPPSFYWRSSTWRRFSSGDVIVCLFPASFNPRVVIVNTFPNTQYQTCFVYKSYFLFLFPPFNLSIDQILHHVPVKMFFDPWGFECSEEHDFFESSCKSLDGKLSGTIPILTFVCWFWCFFLSCFCLNLLLGILIRADLTSIERIPVLFRNAGIFCSLKKFWFWSPYRRGLTRVKVYPSKISVALYFVTFVGAALSS